MRILFSYFDADRDTFIIDHSPSIVMCKLLTSSAQSYNCLPPLPNICFSNILLRQRIKSREIYLKQHSKPFNTKKLKGCRKYR